MNFTHLSNWDQEEYVLGQRTPEMVKHIAQCAACRAGVANLEQGIALFRTSAVQWSSDCLENPTQRQFRSTPAAVVHHAYRWAMATILLLLCLLPIYYLKSHTAKQEKQLASTPGAATIATNTIAASPITDDALLQGVDDEVSVAVPSSMEPLTHLVTTGNSSSGTSTATTGGPGHAQTN